MSHKWGHVSKKTMMFCLKIIELLIALIIVVGGLGFWKLYTEPIEMKDMLPDLMEHVLPANLELSVQAESVMLSAEVREEGLIHVNIQKLVMKRADGTTALTLPDVEMSYGLWQILTLNYTPSTLSIREPVLYLIIDQNGRFHLQNKKERIGLLDKEQKEMIPEIPGEEASLSSQSSSRLDHEIIKESPSQKAMSAKDVAKDVLPMVQKEKTKDQIKASEEKTKKILDAIFRYIFSFSSLSLQEAQVIIDDQQKGKKLEIPSLTLDYEKQFGLTHAMKIDAVLLIDKDLTNLKAEAQLNRITRRMSFDIEADNFVLSRLGRVIPVLQKADLTVQGHVQGLFDFSKKTQNVLSCFEEGTFQIKINQPGFLNLPDPLTNVYPIQEGLIRGAIGRQMREFKVAKSDFVLQDGTKADVRVDITGIDAFLSGKALSNIKTTLRADIDPLPVSKIPAVWPAALGPDAHAWVRSNLSQGYTGKSHFDLYFQGSELVDLFGKLPVEGVRVRYLDEMKPVEQVEGDVYLYPDAVKITVKKGFIDDLHLSKAQIDLTDLQKEISQAHIGLVVRGPVQEAMHLISMKPLEFPQLFGLNPNQTGGYADVDVDLKFPLIESLTQSQVQVNVNAKIVDGVFATPVDDLVLKQGQLNLNVTNRGLTLSGKGSIKGLPVELKWKESFTAEKENDIQSAYDLTGTIETQRLEKMGLDLKGILQGSVQGKFQIEKYMNGRIKGLGYANLRETDIHLKPLSLIKKKGLPASIDLIADISPYLKQGEVTIDLNGLLDAQTKESLTLKGNGTWGAGYRFVLKELNCPGTDISGVLEMDQKKQFLLKLKGKELNLSGLKDFLLKEEETEQEEGQSYKDDTTDEKAFEGEKNENQGSIPNVQQVPLNILIDVQLDKMVLSEKKPLKKIYIYGKKKGYFWENLVAQLDGDQPFSLSFNPTTHTFLATTRNFGDFLERLGISERFAEGKLTLRGEQPERGGLVGSLYVKNLELKDPGFLMQLGTILGIVDAIRGKELTFKEVKIPFELTPHLTLYLKDAYAYGTTLGVTFKGRIRPDFIDLVGSAIPAYAINSLPGKIPLIGDLFTDGKGGGLMGVKYEVKGPLHSPNVNFNPLKSMVPGVFGNLFN